MKKRIHASKMRAVLSVMLVLAILFGNVAMIHAQTGGYDASFVRVMENAPALNLEKYVDSAVMFELPDTVRRDDEISVIIDLDTTDLMTAYEASDKTMSMSEFALSADAQAIEAGIQTRKAEILADLDEQGISYTLGKEYSVLLSGFELMIRASDFQAVCMSLDEGAQAIVGEVYETAETELVENSVNVYSTGIFDSSDSVYDGSGMVVAVLDTGLDSNHSAFSVENFTSEKLGLTYEDVAAVLKETKAYSLAGTLSVDNVYVNEKVPFGYDYADNDPDVYSTHNNHGTHVSGVIVGKDDTITGVAPNAQIVSMKVFSDIMDTARSTWILDALEDCVILGVDVVNMSLGTACGFSRETDEEKLSGVYDKLREAGISVVVAASNSYSSAYGSEANGNLGLTTNPDTSTVGSPGTYAGTLSVASIAGEETPYLLYDKTIIYFDESNNGAAEENDFCETLLGDKDSVTLEYVVIPGVGRSADYTGMDVEGKIALVRRGDNTFEEKAMIAEAQGAAGIIIYNNVSGDIKMNVGEAKLAVCSISQNDGEMLVEAGGGKLKISKEQTSGPFISDFSSWGPGPGLQIKPEITAHGGNILSSVTGGGYDRLSGTSMACPNLAGVVVLLRQYVVENFPEIANDNVKVSAMVNKLIMSTADVALNTNGLPYAVRKQGAGLANLASATGTPAYITTFAADGTEMDTTKLELGDDPERTGVYKMSFEVTNFGDKKLSYEIGALVTTEGVSETKTNSGKTTVTEEAYELAGAVVELTDAEGKVMKNNKISVAAGETQKINVKVTLSDEDKAYLDASFANGMYVEGYITLEAKSGTDIDLSVPYLAFYGDWSVAPMFDLTYFDTNADELDEAIAIEDKTMADAYATRPVGGVSEDYVSYLGSYYFIQDPADMVISANENYIALSNQEGTIHALRFVWAGLLRNAQRIEITITDDTTGKVIFETEDTDVRKSYGDGGSIYPANIEIEFDTLDYNLANNSEYTVRLEGFLDYKNDGSETNEKRVFEFPLTIDFEAPTLSDVEFYYEYDKSMEKNRLFAKAAVYDNHYAMSAQLGYVGTGTDENGNEVPELKSFEQYMTPIYSQEDSTTYVTFELTDYIYDIKENSLNPNSLVITCYDYALNYVTYEVGMPDEYTDFYFDGLEEGITLSPNEVYNLEPLVYPDAAWGELMEFTSSRPSVVRVVNNKLVAVSSGNAMVKVRDPKTNKDITFKVNVLSEDDEGYRRYDKPVAERFELTGYQTLKAYYQVASEDKHIGDTGDIRFFEGKYSLELYPSESLYLNHRLSPYFPNDTKVEYETSNENIVTVENGVVTAVAEGFASVTVKVMLDGRSTYYSETVDVEVLDPYVTNGASLTHYYGLGGVVNIPADLHLKELANFSFANFEYIPKTEEELEFDDAETSKQWYIGDSTVTKVIIPEGVEKIGAYAFANLTGLEEVVLPSTMEAIEYGAFYGCTSLTKITFSSENNLKIVNQSAFENCNLEGILDLSSVCVISDYAFAGNQRLEGITTSDALLSIGEYAFAGCKKLADVTITAPKVKYGAYAFTGCEALNEFYVNAAVLPEGMFYEAENLEKVTVGPDVNDIGEFAFRDTEVSTFEVQSGNKAYKAGSNDYILSADGKSVVAVSPNFTGEFGKANLGGANVTAIAKGAFSHNTDITSVVLPGVTAVGDYAFGSSESITSVTLGTLTEIGEYAFFETGITVLPGFTAETEIGQYAFSFTDITEVNIPNGMTVAEGVFSECLSLETVVIGDDVTLGKYAFNVSTDNCFSIESYTEEISVAGSMAVGEIIEGEDPTGEADGEGFEVEPITEERQNKEDEESEKTEETEETEAAEETEPAEEGETAPTETVEEKYFYYTFATALKNLTIGKNAVIGDNAFTNAASLESVTMGENAKIGYMAFYNNGSLANIDLSKAAEIGDYAFSGDVYYVCVDDSMAYAAVSTEGKYIYTYHAAKLPRVEIATASSIGEYAFAYCRDMTEVVLNDTITEIPQYAFAGCENLTTIDLSKIVTLGDYAFIENHNLANVDLSSAETIGDYAFVYGGALTGLKLNPNGTEIGEGTFSYCEALASVDSSTGAKVVGPYAFAYTAITDIDLSGAETIDDLAFLKEELTPFTVKLGENLAVLGDNPFAMCQVASFGVTEPREFNGVDYSTTNYTYEISDSVRVIDGSVYCDTVNGMELIVYAGTDHIDARVAPGTVRITAMAFAGSDVQMITMPYTTTSIGHKAFYLCDDLETVVFGSYEAPILEEEFDNAYYETFTHIPGSGDFGDYTDYDGSQVQINGMGLLPWFMWNATGGMYSNVYYGANFVDYVGYVQDKLTMIRPVNGVNYDSFIYNQYFDLTIDGPAGADDTTLAAINAIKAIPERVSYEDKALVEAARTAYTRIATTEQLALVTNIADLISAEQRITALTPEGEGAVVETTPDGETVPTQETEPAEDQETPEAPKAEPEGGSGWVVLLTALVLLGGAAGAVILRRKGLNKPAAEETAEAEKSAEVQEEAPEAEEPAETEEVSETETQDEVSDEE